MPWYWTDEVAPVLVSNGTIDQTTAQLLISMPVAYRSEHESLEAAVGELLDDGEIPLAA
ncbi:MAG TPA: hypothetical protein VFS66_12655 [Acidimicrobiia bacterium]|nr:hypothetical protein [Acidimicrobiia bacterium]